MTRRPRRSRRPAETESLDPGVRALDRTWIYKSDLVAVLNELASDGHVERVPDPGDRRRDVNTMTDAGTDCLDQLEGVDLVVRINAQPAPERE